MPKDEMTATEKLDRLFDRWQDEYPVYRGKFTCDGIIKESEYKSQKTKVLFMAKEPNDPEQRGGDFRVWWNDRVKHLFSRRICEWAFGVLHGFPPLNEYPNDSDKRIKILQSIAFMNLKKIGGGASADQDVIKEVVHRERELILEEISIIKPDVIIGGIGRSELWEIIFPNIVFTDTGYGIKAARYNSYSFIDYYHPSYRVPRAMSYSLLGRVYESKIFQELLKA